MNLKEHLQFLMMMIPTLLLLAAAVITLAAPAPSVGAQQSTGADSPHLEVAMVVETEAGSLNAVSVR